MSEINRALVPFTNEHFAAFCEKMIGQPYWFGCCLYKATGSLLTRKTNQYPSSYASSRTARYKQDIANRKIVADCIGGRRATCDRRWVGVEALGTDRPFQSMVPMVVPTWAPLYVTRKTRAWMGRDRHAAEMWTGAAKPATAGIRWRFAVEWKGSVWCVKTSGGPWWTTVHVPISVGMWLRLSRILLL